jgi:hypothetical protein
MTPALAVTYALAVEIRHVDTGTVLGVALVVPSDRHLAFLAEGAAVVTISNLSDNLWREISAWAADGDARLPAKPAPMSPWVVAAVLGGGLPSGVSAQRFAAIPITVTSHDELARLADRLLPDLLNARRSGA